MYAYDAGFVFRSATSLANMATAVMKAFNGIGLPVSEKKTKIMFLQQPGTASKNLSIETAG